MLPSFMRRHNGYTIIELTVVMGIIAVLLSLSLAGVNSARIRSRDARRIADIRTIQSALEMYVINDPGHNYPGKNDIDPSSNSVTPLCSDIYATTNCFTQYLSVIPKDPFFKDASGGFLQYSYASPACFVMQNGKFSGLNSSATSQATCGAGNAYNPHYGLHARLEASNNEATNDVTPTDAMSYDIAP